MKEYNDTKKVEDLDPKVLAEAIEIARNLQANSSNNSVASKDITKHKSILSKLLEYLILNQDNPNMDLSLILFLEKALGITKSQKKKKRDMKDSDNSTNVSTIKTQQNLSPHLGK